METNQQHAVSPMTHEEYEAELMKYPELQAAVQVAMGYVQAFKFVAGE